MRRSDIDGCVAARARAGHCDNLLPNVKARYAFTKRPYRSRHFEPWDKRRLRHAGHILELALAEEQVDEADSGVGDIDRHLARTGRGVRKMNHLENIWITEANSLDSLHGKFRFYSTIVNNAPNDALSAFNEH